MLPACGPWVPRPRSRGTIAALGWGAAPHPMGLQGPALVHSGSDGNWFALVCLFPGTGDGVLVVANAAESMGGDQASLAALRALATTVAAPAVLTSSGTP